LVLIDHNRFLEWEALFSYLNENREELEAQGRMTALTLCLQRHWADISKEIPDWF